jgi:hypothetical protein
MTNILKGPKDPKVLRVKHCQGQADHREHTRNLKVIPVQSPQVLPKELPPEAPLEAHRVLLHKEPLRLFPLGVRKQAHLLLLVQLL